MDQIVLGIFCVIGFAALMLVIKACAAPPVLAPPPLYPGSDECPHDMAYWRGQGERCHRCGWGIMKIPDCHHEWEYVSGNERTEGGKIQQCQLCGCNRLSFFLGDIHPGESKSVSFGVRIGD